MARHDKSDDSGDRDYDPHQDKSKKVKTTAVSRRSGTNSLPTPGLTPTDPTFAAQFAMYHQQRYSTQHGLQPPFLVLPPLPPTLQTPTFFLNGMLQHDDEVLDAQLNFSRRGKQGHCSRDTADVWLYILHVFFPAEEGYGLSVNNYHEQTEDDSRDEDQIPSGDAVTIQLWKKEVQFHALRQQWVTTSSTPILTVLCSSTESRFSEFPATRHKVDNRQDLFATTPLQTHLYKQLCNLLQHHSSTVAQGFNRASLLKSIDGAIACGTMVRFFKVKAGTEGSGWFRTWSAKGLDLVNGDPSASKAFIERILLRIKGSSRKRNLGRT